MTRGVQRGLFSNEAGMGSAPNAAASASPYPPHPASQGYVQMLGVFIDTIVICSATAAIILSSGILDQPTDSISGIDLSARCRPPSAVGAPFVAIAIFFFAFTSIIANYAYAESNGIPRAQPPGRPDHFRCVALGMVMFGALAELPLVENGGYLHGADGHHQSTAILLLSRVALKLADDYHRQRRLGKLPTFDANRYPG